MTHGAGLVVWREAPDAVLSPETMDRLRRFSGAGARKDESN
jgi:hypothetical protein